jgi:hypothetical protein
MIILESFRIFEVALLATMIIEEDAKSLESVILVTFHNLHAFHKPARFSISNVSTNRSSCTSK